MSTGLDPVAQDTSVLHGAVRGPWTGGFKSSVEPFMAGTNNIVGDTDGSHTYSSRNVLIDPFDGSICKRYGCSAVNSSYSGAYLTSGLLNGNWAPKARKLFAIDSPSLSNGLPTLSVLFGNDASRRGTIYLNSSNSGANSNDLKNYSLLEEFGYGTTYSRTPSSSTGSASYRLKVVPTFVDSGSGLYNRGSMIGTSWNDKFLQQFLTCGSRNVLLTEKYLYAPNLHGNPWKWDKRFNEDATTGSEVVRIFPTGPWPPLFPPTATTPAAAASSATWEDGDTYFLSVIFKFEDGSYSAPCIPRLPNSLLPSGYGFVTVGTIGGASKYRYMTYSNVAIGPEGTVARIILRTTKQKRTATTDAITIAPLDLRIVGVIDNNRDTTYVDYFGNDNSLLEDDSVVRLDRVLPRRARYIGTGDQRAIVSYTLPNQSAFMLAPVGNSTSFDLNVADSSDSAYISTGFYFKINGGINGASNITLVARSGAGPWMNALSLDSLGVGFPNGTLNDVVDAINSTTTASQCKQWRAQLAPGIDGSLLLTNLAPSVQVIGAVTCTNNSATLTASAGSFASIPIGACIHNADWDQSTYTITASVIPAGTYVLSKSADNGTITMSANATGTRTAVCTFYSDTGDDDLSWQSGVLLGSAFRGGHIRSFCPALPGVGFLAPYKTTFAAKDALLPDRTSVYFTTSAPGDAANGVSLSPDAWVANNRRMPHSAPNASSKRTCMGIADIEGAAVVAYTDGIHMLMNLRGSNTGEDDDVRLYTVNDTRGCVSYLGMTSGNGWAAYVTPQGIMAVDKSRREVNISNAIHNPSTGAGELAYEMALSAASSAADTDDQYMSLATIGSRLLCAVRYDRGGTIASKVLTYDFSPGVDASGLEELLDSGSQQVYAWSAPADYNSSKYNMLIGPMGSVRLDSLYEYIAVDSNYSGVAGGHVERINYGDNDNGLLALAIVYLPPAMASDFHLLQPQVVEATHLTVIGSGSQTQLQFDNTQTPTLNAALFRKLPVSTSKTRVHKQVIPIDTTQRGVTDMFWMVWRSSANPGNKLWKLSLRYTEVKNSNTSIAGA